MEYHNGYNLITFPDNALHSPQTPVVVTNTGVNTRLHSDFIRDGRGSVLQLAR
ncbi:hypothetical protein AGMMS49992_00730 [Clostridia bacterium]|nr:hypothetical protein AGMMS49992_00730 [Clostridia bacterium]